MKHCLWNNLTIFIFITNINPEFSAQNELLSIVEDFENSASFPTKMKQPKILYFKVKI